MFSLKSYECSVFFFLFGTIFKIKILSYLYIIIYIYLLQVKLEDMHKVPYICYYENYNLFFKIKFSLSNYILNV